MPREKDPEYNFRFQNMMSLLGYISTGFAHEIFDPFYTTKTNSLGIGLTVSHQIVTAHGGLLKVSRGKKGGAEFILEMPIGKSA